MDSGNDLLIVQPLHSLKYGIRTMTMSMPTQRRMLMNMQMPEFASIATVNSNIGRMTASSRMIQFLDRFNFTDPLASEYYVQLINLLALCQTYFSLFFRTNFSPDQVSSMDETLTSDRPFATPASLTSLPLRSVFI